MRISVIIPTYNRREQLKNSLESFVVQKIPFKEFEIIIIDDNSNDEFFSLIKEFSNKAFNIKYLRTNTKSGPAFCRNLGIENSKGEIIVFTDSDCLPDSNWLYFIDKICTQEKSIDIIGGLTYTKGFKASIIQFMANSAIRQVVNDKSEIVFFPTCNVALKKHIFFKNKFNEKFKFAGGEDLEFFWRLYKKGYNFFLNDKIKILHDKKINFLEFIRHPFIYGRTNFLVKKIHPDHPALQDIKVDNFFIFIYSLMQHGFLNFFLSFKLSLKFYFKYKFNFILAYFYFLVFRVAYLSGFFYETLRFKYGYNKIR